MTGQLTDLITSLEYQLLHTDFGNHPELLSQLLAKDFKEIGGNGCVTERTEVLKWLLNKNRDSRWLFLNFKIRRLNEKLLLATYQAKRVEVKDPSYQGSMHSSLWQSNGENWQMLFHQSTKITNINTDANTNTAFG